MPIESTTYHVLQSHASTPDPRLTSRVFSVGNLVLRHSVPHFLPNSGGIVCWVAELNTALFFDTRAKKWKYKSPPRVGTFCSSAPRLALSVSINSELKYMINNLKLILTVPDHFDNASVHSTRGSSTRDFACARLAAQTTGAFPSSESN